MINKFKDYLIIILGVGIIICIGIIPTGSKVYSTTINTNTLIDNTIKFSEFIHKTMYNYSKEQFKDFQYLNKYSNIPMTDDLKLHIRNVCKLYDFDEDIIYKIIYHESRYHQYSDNGICKGLMQVHSRYSDYYAKQSDGVYNISSNYDIYDPYTNILLGIRCLSEWRETAISYGYTDIKDWLSFYNMGWSYMTYGSNGYAEKILNTDLESLTFSSYKIIGN